MFLSLLRRLRVLRLLAHACKTLEGAQGWSPAQSGKLANVDEDMCFRHFKATCSVTGLLAEYHLERYLGCRLSLCSSRSFACNLLTWHCCKGVTDTRIQNLQWAYLGLATVQQSKIVRCVCLLCLPVTTVQYHVGCPAGGGCAGCRSQ